MDLNQTVEEGISLIRRLIGEDIAVEFTPRRDLWRVRVDRGQIQQVLLNLASNARDAMPMGGTLKLALENAKLSDEQLRRLRDEAR